VTADHFPRDTSGPLDLRPCDDLERRCVEDGAVIVEAVDPRTGTRFRAVDMTYVIRGATKAKEVSNER
jgi:hypothetical protein